MDNTIITLLKNAITALQALLNSMQSAPAQTPATVAVPIPPPVLTNREKLVVFARTMIGVDMTPGDEIPDMVACVAQVQELMRRFRGSYIGTGAALYNTKSFLDQLVKDKDFKEVTAPLPGDIIVSATGTGNGTVTGHTGIVDDPHIMSNDSYTGFWSTKYTMATWIARYTTAGGIKNRFFRING